MILPYKIIPYSFKPLRTEWRTNSLVEVKEIFSSSINSSIFSLKTFGKGTYTQSVINILYIYNMSLIHLKYWNYKKSIWNAKTIHIIIILVGNKYFFIVSLLYIYHMSIIPVFQEAHLNVYSKILY